MSKRTIYTSMGRFIMLSISFTAWVVQNYHSRRKNVVESPPTLIAWWRTKQAVNSKYQAHTRDFFQATIVTVTSISDTLVCSPLILILDAFAAFSAHVSPLERSSNQNFLTRFCASYARRRFEQTVSYT
jgi:hypothetical protein